MLVLRYSKNKEIFFYASDFNPRVSRHVIFSPASFEMWGTFDYFIFDSPTYEVIWKTYPLIIYTYPLIVYTAQLGFI